ncbi:hypothetical protein I3843_07G109300 [Carya illinoinensis]|nr:hypothetical protein I3843_07G109300 [Carya illinoinensis]
MKFGWDFKTGLDRRLSAWKNWDDPSPEDFTWGIERTNYPKAVMWKGSEKYYRSGPWNGLRFSDAPELRGNPVFEFSFVNNENEVYYEYHLPNKSIISRIVMNQTKYSRERYIWIAATSTWSPYSYVPRDNCDDYNLCGAYGNCIIGESPVCQCLKGFQSKSQERWNPEDWSQGCVRITQLSCQDKDKHGFIKFVGLKLPETTNSWVNESMNLEECRTKCLSNCSCMAYTNSDIRGRGSGCTLWYGDLLDIRQFPTAKSVLIGQNREVQEEDMELPMLDLSIISRATDGFSVTNKLGEGGFGPVYRGVLADGQEVAMKRLSRISGQGPDEFRNEVKLIAKLQHRNLILYKIGPNRTDYTPSIEGEEKMLVYEYMPNKSLDSILFDFISSHLIPSQKNDAFICVQQRPEDRPSMSTVVLMLGSEIALPQPKEPGFLMEKYSRKTFSSSSYKHESSSTNEISISILEGR